jgi:hypothetical protein
MSLASASTRTSTGTSGLPCDPYSMAFITVSATAVLSRSRRVGSRPSGSMAAATRFIASRSLPIAPATENAARGSAATDADGASSCVIGTSGRSVDHSSETPADRCRATSVMSSSCSQPAPVKACRLSSR